MEYYYLTFAIIFAIGFIITLILFFVSKRKTKTYHDTTEKTIKILTEAAATKEEKITDLSKKLSEQKNTVFFLQNDIEEQKKVIITIREENARLSLQTEELKQEKDRLLSIIDDLSEDVDDLSKDRDEYQKAYENLKNILEDSNITVKHDPIEEIPPDKMQLDENQNKVYELMCSGKNLFITGKAGTGKSFLLRYYQTHANKKTIFTAPTGIAAINIHGSTLHSVFGFNNLLYGKLSEPELSANQIDFLKQIDTLIIDEISMVSSGTFERLDEIFKLARNNSTPFGGVQLIVFGDPFQLPPVEKSKDIVEALTDRFGGIYFFKADAYADADFCFYELTESHRQEQDKPFLEILDAIRVGNVSQEIIDKLNERYYRNLGINDFQDFCFRNRIVQLVPRNMQADNITERALAEIKKEKMFIYKAQNVFIDETSYDSIEKFYKEVQAPEELQLKVGALVMMIKNDSSAYNRWVNGTMGIVEALTDNSISVAINKTIYTLSRDTFEVQQAEYNKKTGKIVYRVVGTMQQFPLIPAYAITIHKAQGQTYERLACDLSQCFTNGQAYVALSRCKTLNELYLASPIRPGVIKTDPVITEFYNDVISTKNNRPE